MTPMRRAAAMALPYAQVRQMLEHGYIDGATWRWYRFFWVWGAMRLSDTEDANRLQHRVLCTRGMDGLERRIQRVKRLLRAALQSQA
jgi:hypothetical protein